MSISSDRAPEVSVGSYRSIDESRRIDGRYSIPPTAEISTGIRKRARLSSIVDDAERFSREAEQAKRLAMDPAQILREINIMQQRLLEDGNFFKGMSEAGRDACALAIAQMYFVAKGGCNKTGKESLDRKLRSIKQMDDSMPMRNRVNIMARIGDWLNGKEIMWENDYWTIAAASSHIYGTGPDPKVKIRNNRTAREQLISLIDVLSGLKVYG